MLEMLYETYQVAHKVVPLLVGLLSGGEAAVVLSDFRMLRLPDGLPLGFLGGAGVLFAMFRLINPIQSNRSINQSIN